MNAKTVGGCNMKRKKTNISKGVSKHLFTSNLDSKIEDNNLYTKFNFIRRKQDIKRFKENVSQNRD